VQPWILLKLQKKKRFGREGQCVSIESPRMLFKRIHLSPVSLEVLLLFKVGEVVIHNQVGSLTLAHRILAEIPPDKTQWRREFECPPHPHELVDIATLEQNPFLRSHN
jgi:hypothetical protein